MIIFFLSLTLAALALVFRSDEGGLDAGCAVLPLLDAKLGRASTLALAAVRIQCPDQPALLFGRLYRVDHLGVRTAAWAPAANDPH